MSATNRHRHTASHEEAVRELRSLRDLLRYTVSRFEAAALAYGHGTGNAWDEAVALLLWSLQLPPDTLEPYLDARLCESERRAALRLVEHRIVSRQPAAYITGEAWLGGLRLRCDARALVPRSPIAEALDEALPQWLAQWRGESDASDEPAESDEPGGSSGSAESGARGMSDGSTESGAPAASDWPRQILDLCTGGGSLAIIAADRFPRAVVVGADLSADALALAAENRAEHGLDARIELVAGDLFEPLAGRRFDLVVCNPPYVNAASMSALPAEYRAEPAQALAGGPDGMDVVRRIVQQAHAHLNRAGLLLLEIGHEAEHFEAAFPKLEFHYLPVTAGERMLVLIEAGQLGRYAAAASRAGAAPRGASAASGSEAAAASDAAPSGAPASGDASSGEATAATSPTTRRRRRARRP